MTLDGEITLIGSANMDRRSFELNYENNILFYDPALLADTEALTRPPRDPDSVVSRDDAAAGRRWLTDRYDRATIP